MYVKRQVGKRKKNKWRYKNQTSQNKVRTNRIFKKGIKLEKYLTLINNMDLSDILVQFRLSNQTLKKETGWYNEIPVQERI